MNLHLPLAVSIFVVLAISTIPFRTKEKATVQKLSYRKIYSQTLTKSDLGLIWLVHYPQTGGQFVHRLVQRITGYSTATNYGHETFMSPDGTKQLDSKLVFPNYPRGPFFRSNLKPPPRFIMTDTQCARFSHYNNAEHYVMKVRDLMLFERECRSGKRYDSTADEKQAVEYDNEIVHKVIHLIRNPFDVVVSRYREELRSRREKNDVAFLKKYKNNVEGFKLFCHDLDTNEERLRDEKPWIEPEISALISGVPCHAEFYRYLKFINAQFLMANAMNVPQMVLRLEDFRVDLEGISAKLLYFLELSREQTLPGPEFRFRGGYAMTYYTSEQIKAVKKFVTEVTSGSGAAGIMKAYMDDIRVFTMWQ